MTKIPFLTKKKRESDSPFQYLVLRQRTFRFIRQSGKRHFVEYGDVCQDLTVDFNRSFFQAINEAAVRNAVLTGCGVDTRNPQLTELTFLLTTVTVGVLACFDNRLEGNTVHTRTGTVIAFRFFQNLFVTCTSGHTTFYASHMLSPKVLFKPIKQRLSIRQTCDDQTEIPFGDQALRTQMTFTFSRFFGQNMTQVSMLALKAATGGFLKAFGSAAYCLDFWH